MESFSVFNGKLVYGWKQYLQWGSCTQIPQYEGDSKKKKKKQKNTAILLMSRWIYQDNGW